MENTKDTYYTLTTASEQTLHKDRGSKFYGYAFPVTNQQDIKECIDKLKKQHHTARHFCYAWQLGEMYQKSSHFLLHLHHASLLSIIILAIRLTDRW